MSVVANTELIEHELGRWQPTDVAFIRRFAYENWDGRSFDLALMVLMQPRGPLSSGWPDPAQPFWEVEIVFHDVRDLSITVQG
ncbi:MAG TPA: hypothetical protein VKI65_14510, partial [Gemmataceae bacterium]|nr:hypothetical protein [Gemmataceae bacterium]